MRTFLHAGLLALLGAALLRCSADGAGAPEELDGGGAPPVDGAAPADGDVDSPDSEGEDAGNCSADHWCRTPLPSDGLKLTAVWSFAADDAFAASTTKLLHWDGAAWVAVKNADLEGLTSLWATTPNDLWGVAQGNYHLVHGARAAPGQPFTWSKIQYDSETSATMNILRGVGASELWVYGQLFGQHVLQHGVVTNESLDGGPITTDLSWSTIPITVPRFRALNSFCVTPGGEIWIAGSLALSKWGIGVVVRGVPSAEDASSYTWSEVLTRPLDDHTALTAIWGESAADLWTMGNMGVNFRGGAQGDGGVEWTPVPSNANATANGIWGIASDDIWSVGRVGAIRHWDGTEWGMSRVATSSLPLWKDLAAVHAGPAGDVWAVGDGVALHREAGAP